MPLNFTVIENPDRQRIVGLGNCNQQKVDEDGYQSVDFSVPRVAPIHGSQL
jgi:hypothetical protein